ncbi:universal stress protein [Saccharothrix obliqua]|uniref:universal stress protein n=1 Tax=Saccharothrix obliqua TaxID=2861747 RepID=UPI001C6058D0|nr:universal stress protein [Saccharothrix obliqua]MBW4717905.1 universal stress protein [Saccharothrix obliqua]
MSTTAPIVVGIDGSPAAERALRWAMDEAQQRGAPLHVVNAYAYEPLTDWTLASEQDARVRSEALIEDALHVVAVGRAELPPIIRHCVRGPAAEALEERARGAAMLVVAAHGGNRFRRALLGSTSAHCVRHATTPVVVLPATAGEPAVTR